MTNNETTQTISESTFNVNDLDIEARVKIPRFSKALTKEEMKGLAAMSAEEAYYHLRILPTRDNFKAKLSVECENYPAGCATCCNKIFVPDSREGTILTCNFGKHLADTVEPMVLSMLEESE